MGHARQGIIESYKMKSILLVTSHAKNERHYILK